MSKRVRRLLEDFIPKHYELNMEPNRDTLVLSGTVRVDGQKVSRPSRRLTFHQNGLKIKHATITKHDKKGSHEVTISRVLHHKKLNEVRLHTEAMLYPGEYTVHMTFEGKVQSGMKGVYYSDYKEGDEQKRMISTQLESHFARMAFPCIDEPAAKATFTLSLTTPLHEPVLSNMPPAKQKEQDEKLHTAFQKTPRMSPYLVAFAFGDLQHKDAKTKSGVDVRIWSTKAFTHQSLDFALKTAVRGVEFFEEYFDTPYPLPKSDHLAVPDFAAAGMENWGLVTYREMALIADPETVSQTNKELIAEVILHEISHHWFGDLVTMEWWDSVWLNESFANVMAFIAIDKLFPKWGIWNSYIATDGLAAFRRDSIAGVQAIKTDIRHPDEINSIFDPSIVYAKGGRLINMLVQYLGEEDFRQGLKAYFTKHAYGNTIGQDLWEALASASSKDVSHIMEPWLDKSGFPAIELTQNGASLNITQSHFLADPTKADSERIWPIPLLADTTQLPTLLAQSHLDLDLKSKKFVRINKGAVGHYIVHYVNPEHAKAIAELAADKKLTPAERLVLLNDSSMLARGGRQSFSATLQLLDHYKKEDDESVWSIIALILADLRRFVDIDGTIEEPMRSLIRELIDAQYQRLGWKEIPRESTRDTKLRALIIGLGVYSKHPHIVREALELFEMYKKDNTKVPAELRGVVFAAAVREQAHDAFNFLLELDDTTLNTALKLDLMDALTDTRKQEQVTLLLGRLKDGAKVRQHDVDHWIAYLLRNRHSKKQAWEWLQNNWDWIEETFADDHSYDYLPRYAASAFNTPQLLDEYKTFFEPLKVQPALARSVSLGIEEIENRVAWLQRDIAAIKTHFL